MDKLSGEGCTLVLNNAGTEDGTIIAEKIYCTLIYTQKLEVRTGSVDRKLAEDSQTEKVMLASGAAFVLLCEVPCSWKLRKPDASIPCGKLQERLRVIPGQRQSASGWSN